MWERLSLLVFVKNCWVEGGRNPNFFTVAVANETFLCHKAWISSCAVIPGHLWWPWNYLHAFWWTDSMVDFWKHRSLKSSEFLDRLWCWRFTLSDSAWVCLLASRWDEDVDLLVWVLECSMPERKLVNHRYKFRGRHFGPVYWNDMYFLITEKNLE